MTIKERYQKAYRAKRRLESPSTPDFLKHSSAQFLWEEIPFTVYNHIDLAYKQRNKPDTYNWMNFYRQRRFETLLEKIAYRCCHCNDRIWVGALRYGKLWCRDCLEELLS